MSDKSLPDLEQIMTLSPAFRNSLASAYPIPESSEKRLYNTRKA